MYNKLAMINLVQLYKVIYNKIAYYLTSFIYKKVYFIKESSLL